MNSFGIVPPTMADSNTKPAPSSPGSIVYSIFAYWPVPPVCFLCV